MKKSTMVSLAIGAAAVGAGAYYFMRKSGASTPAATASTPPKVSTRKVALPRIGDKKFRPGPVFKWNTPKMAGMGQDFYEDAGIVDVPTDVSVPQGVDPYYYQNQQSSWSQQQYQYQQQAAQQAAMLQQQQQQMWQQYWLGQQAQYDAMQSVPSGSIPYAQSVYQSPSIPTINLPYAQPMRQGPYAAADELLNWGIQNGSLIPLKVSKKFCGSYSSRYCNVIFKSPYKSGNLSYQQALNIVIKLRGM